MSVKSALDYPLNISHKLINFLKQNEKFIFSYWQNLIRQANLDAILKFSTRELEILMHQYMDWFIQSIQNGTSYVERIEKAPYYIYPTNIETEKNISLLVRKYLRRNIPLHQYQVANSLLRRAIQYLLKENFSSGQGEYIYAIETIENYFSQILLISTQIWEQQQKIIQSQRPELIGLYNIATCVSANPNQEELLDVIVKEIVKLLNVDFCFLLLHNDIESNILEISASYVNKHYTNFLQNMHFKTDDDSLISKVFRSGSVLRSTNPITDVDVTIRTLKKLELLGFNYILAAPLKIHNMVLGIICVGSKDTDFDSSDITLLTTISSQAASSIYNAQLVSANQSLSVEMVLSLAKLIDERDPYTHNHSANVAQYATELAKAINYPPEKYNLITMAGLLHDIGKIGIADAILHKPGRLTNGEREIMMTHAIKGAQVLQPVRGLHYIIPAVKHHHENYNGTGYPSRITGEEIPIEARILNITDAYDTMASNRVYRQAMSKEEIIKEFQKMSGIQFDPVLVPVFLNMLPSFTELDHHSKYIEINKPKPVVEDFSDKKLNINEFSAQRLRAFFNIIRAIGSTLDPKEVLHRSVNAAKSLLMADYTCFWLYENEELKPVCWTMGFEFTECPCFRIKDNDMISYVAYRRIPVIVTDFMQEKRFKISDYINKKQLTSAIVVPAESAERLIGIVTVYTKAIRNFNIDDVTIITALAEQTATALENAQIHQKKTDLPNTDSLTNLYNHRFFYEHLNFEINRSKRYKNNFSLIMMNIDRFKEYNELNGYFFGDETLKAIGEIIKNSARQVDIAARYSGEEFAIITPECNLEQSIVLAKRLKKTIFSTPFPTKSSTAFTKLTISLAITEFQKELYETPESMVNQTKNLIKKAKQAGGNKIEV